MALGGIVVAAGAVTAFQLISARTSERPKLSIRLGEDRCRRCGMIISRLEFAGGILLKDRRSWYVYDDVGCLAYDYNELTSKGMEVEDVRVFDFETREELDARSAHYVLADPRKLWTPMSYGVVAVGNREKAEELARRFGGEVGDFWSVLSRFR